MSWFLCASQLPSQSRDFPLSAIYSTEKNISRPITTITSTRHHLGIVVDKKCPPMKIRGDGIKLVSKPPTFSTH
jgi:hypothetical protein